MYVSSDRNPLINQKILAQEQLLKLISTQEGIPLHQRVQIGDIMKAEIIDCLQKQIKLMLVDGTTLVAQLDEDFPVSIGQKVTLQVNDITGSQIMMKFVTKEEVAQASNKEAIFNILQQLNVTSTDDTQIAVESLMKEMLPVTKENIRQLALGLKNSSLPMATLIGMLESEMPITQNTLNQMEAYQNGEIKLQTQLQSIIAHIGCIEHPDMLKEIHTILVDHILSTENTSVEHGTIEPSSSQLQVRLSKEPFLVNDIVELQQSIEILCKELFFIRPEELKTNKKSRLQTLNELYKTIYEVTDALEKVENKIQLEPNIAVYKEIKANIEFLTIMSRYDTMLHIPLLLQNQYKHGEVYVFHKKKKVKKDYSEASILISLDTVSLGTIETYIQKYQNQIQCQFRIESKTIETIIRSHAPLLQQNLKEKGYYLTSITYIPQSEIFTIPQNNDVNINPVRYHFDTKV